MDSGPPVGPDSETGSTANSGSEKICKKICEIQIQIKQEIYFVFVSTVSGFVVVVITNNLFFKVFNWLHDHWFILITFLVELALKMKMKKI